MQASSSTKTSSVGEEHSAKGEKNSGEEESKIKAPVNVLLLLLKKKRSLRSGR